MDYATIGAVPSAIFVMAALIGPLIAAAHQHATDGEPVADEAAGETA